MKMRIIALFFVVLVSLFFVDARNFFSTQYSGKLAENGVTSVKIQPAFWSSQGLSPEFICLSCLEVSRNTMKALSDPLLPEKVSTFVNDACHILPSDMRVKISDDKNCGACHTAVEDIRDHLEDPDMKIKVIKILLKACNNVENHAKECKRMVMEYGPLILANIGKYLDNNDFCSIVHICKPSTHDTLTTTEDFHPIIELPTSSSGAISK
ncbi:uncharacterized protein LOC122093119 isoform X4 [Macadamia integrifolia]|uniref:uncharacterized protein LOC122093119 isoform X4 n=1 Tax=Macadamia integrifolia TaxID=60698 RepID=UPI001C532B00|nr:uncharacterized protein LOC122093119 isoform X4 [Macadamia integrifolia]